MRRRVLVLLTFCGMGILFPLAAQQHATSSPEKPQQETLKYDAVLATVDGEPITRLDVMIESGNTEQSMRKLFSANELDIKLLEHRRRILNDLIDRKLVLRDYKKYNYPIPRQMIEDAVDKVAKNIGDGSRDTLKEKLKQMGMPLPELYKQAKDRIAAELMVYEYCTRRVQSTPKERYDYYVAHPEDFTIARQWELQILHLQPDVADSVVSFILDTLSTDSSQFQSLLKTYGTGISSSPGQSTSFADHALRGDFRTAIVNLPAGKTITEPIRIPEGVFFLHVKTCGKPQLRTFDEVTDEIKELIERPQREKRSLEYFARLRSQAIIRNFSGDTL